MNRLCLIFSYKDNVDKAACLTGAAVTGSVLSRSASDMSATLVLKYDRQFGPREADRSAFARVNYSFK